MSRVRFAYIVQVDMEGSPIKVGHSSCVWRRYQGFVGHTPAAIRLLGATIDGIERERQLKVALAPTLIHGEWGYPNPGIADLVRQWVEAGEWFVPAADRKAAFRANDVVARAAKFGTDASVTPVAIGYQWATELLQRAEHEDPLLGLHWDGFERSAVMPDLRLPKLKAA